MKKLSLIVFVSMIFMFGCNIDPAMKISDQVEATKKCKENNGISIPIYNGYGEITSFNCIPKETVEYLENKLKNTKEKK